MREDEILAIKSRYTRVRLVNMLGEPQMYSGLEGTVHIVDDMGQIHVNWDNGSSLALNVEVDSFEIANTTIQNKKISK